MARMTFVSSIISMDEDRVIWIPRELRKEASKFPLKKQLKITLDDEL